MAKNKKKKSTSEKSEKETKKVALDKAEDVVDDIKEAKKSKKDKDTDKKEPNKLAKWFKDLRIEFKKVVWPSKETVVTNTSVVVGVIALSAILVGLLDEGFLTLMRLIYQ